MTSLDTIRRQICDQPYDVALRLVYAERLGGTGDPDSRQWADFIRWQVGTEEGPCPVPIAFLRHRCRLFLRRPKFYPNSQYHNRREMLLMEDRVPDDPWYPRVEAVSVARGFVSKVQCEAERWVAVGPRLVAEHPIVELSLWGIGMEIRHDADSLGGMVRLYDPVPPFATAAEFNIDPGWADYAATRLNFEAIAWARAEAGLPPL